MENKPIDINESKIKNLIESFRAEDPEIRTKLDYGYSFGALEAILYEIRPTCDQPTQTQHFPFAKIRFHKSNQIWKLYWMRSEGILGAFWIDR